MGEYFEIELTKRELSLLEDYNNSIIEAERVVIKNPKICIEQNDKIKTIMVCPNEGYWGVSVYRTKRQKPISEKEAHQKTLKLLKILNGVSGL